jgi:hypothetical protein
MRWVFCFLFQPEFWGKVRATECDAQDEETGGDEEDSEEAEDTANSEWTSHSETNSQVHCADICLGT